MTHRLTASLLLPLLTACAAASPPANQASPVTLQVEALSPDVYNLVWLRATLRNQGPKRVWVIDQGDTVDLACRMPQGIGLTGLTPMGDTLAFCQRCFIKGGSVQYVPLEPGQQRVVYLNADFNYVFPARALAAMAEPCSKYANRTPGEYRLTVVYGPDGLRSKRGSLGPLTGNTVVVHRKK